MLLNVKHPSVISVFLSKEYKLHTTRSWDFLGLEIYGEIYGESARWKGKVGEDTFISNMDSRKSYTTLYFIITQENLDMKY